MIKILFGAIGGFLAIYFLTKKPKTDDLEWRQFDRDCHNEFMQKLEDAKHYNRYCLEREMEDKKAEEINKYRDLEPRKWWYYFEIGAINIEWCKPQQMRLYEVYDEKTAKYLNGNMEELLKAEYAANNPDKAEPVKIFIPEMI